jgi:hypothetical protein
MIWTGFPPALKVRAEGSSDISRQRTCGGVRTIPFSAADPFVVSASMRVIEHLACLMVDKKSITIYAEVYKILLTFFRDCNCKSVRLILTVSFY